MGKASKSDSFSLALSGDVMLTRPVSRHVEPEFLRLVDVLRAADATFVNLETCVRWWDEGTPSITTGTPMTTTPDLLDELKWLGVDMVSSEGEAGVMSNLTRKAEAADAMFARLVELMGNELRLEADNRLTRTQEAPQWL